jgi:hypothetical protein
MLSQATPNPIYDYRLKVYDNFHYGDESEAYDHGSYATYCRSTAEQVTQMDQGLYIQNILNNARQYILNTI